MSSTVRPDVRAFFVRYARAGRDLDLDTLSSSFAENFLSLDPNSAVALTPQALIAVLPRRKALFESVGSDGLELNELTETPLDDVHTLVRALWTLRMREPRSESVSVRSTFVLRREGGAWRIVVYLNHEDVAELLGSLASKPA
jgi:ketosteroid isomerase-like protein